MHISGSTFAKPAALFLSPSSRSQRIRSLADGQRAYLDDVVAQSGQTLSAIARAANINPSTLTRFRNRDDHAGALSYLTIASIADVTGVPAPVEILGEPAPTPGASRSRGMRETEAEPYLADTTSDLDKAVAAFVADRNHVVPWELKSRSLEFEGWKSGDILAVDLNIRPGDGDIVCVQLYDWNNHAATQTVFRVYEAPFVMAAGPVEGGRKPRLVDNENVAIKGVVTGMFRGRQMRG